MYNDTRQTTDRICLADSENNVTASMLEDSTNDPDSSAGGFLTEETSVEEAAEDTPDTGDE